MGRHEAYQSTLTEKANGAIRQWFASRNIKLPRIPRLPRRALLPVRAFLWVTAMLWVTIVDPYCGNLAAAYAADFSFVSNNPDAQASDIIEPATVSFARGGFNIVGAKSDSLFVASAPAPDPGTAMAFAFSLSSQLGWGQDQYSCLVKLWTRESHWNVLATNASSGAYGIPQALPGSKMASEGSDWATNPETQIRWGVKYIAGRYTNPCTALVHSNNNGWY